jgi:hypothetical protein
MDDIGNAWKLELTSSPILISFLYELFASKNFYHINSLLISPSPYSSIFMLLKQRKNGAAKMSS